jgi:hypothetical protein
MVVDETLHFTKTYQTISNFALCLPLSWNKLYLYIQYFVRKINILLKVVYKGMYGLKYLCEKNGEGHKGRILDGMGLNIFAKKQVRNRFALLASME